MPLPNTPQETIVNKRSLVGIGIDTAGWWQRFRDYCVERDIPHKVVEFERSDWRSQLEACDAVIWRPNLDPPYLEEGREKLYHLEHIEGKRVLPNWHSFWHYDNKRAQSYLFRAHDIRCADTFVSYSAEEAREYSEHATYPLVSKNSSGAASADVRLLRCPADALREVRLTFARGWTERALKRAGITLRLSRREKRGYVLWQEFVPGNDSDIRITVIDRRYAFAFRRFNRPGDFRASGSGRISYPDSGFEAECAYCADICRRLDFDVMCFDLLYRDGEFIIVEMSYTFMAQAVHNAAWHYEIDTQGQLVRHDGHVWPQDLLMAALLGHRA